MLTHLFLAAGFDPSAVIGGKLNAINGSGRAGSSQTFVVEACEFVDTFLHISPDIAVILNIDNDHMDYFKPDNAINSFRSFESSLQNRCLQRRRREYQKAVPNLDSDGLIRSVDSNDY
jgi:UDP-N-acetylmuramate--alanine ligase